jgi:hypothetical protein
MIHSRSWSYAYCGRCMRSVRVAYTGMPTHEGHANIPDAPELICLDVTGPFCDGTCPLSNLTHETMLTRLDRSRIREDDLYPETSL